MASSVRSSVVNRNGNGAIAMAQTHEERKVKARLRMAALNAAHPERAMEVARRWREQNRDRYLQLKFAQSMRRRIRLGGKCRKHDAHVKAWIQRNKPQRQRLHCSHVTAWSKAKPGDAWRNKYRNDPEFNIKERVRNQIKKKKAIVPGIAELVRSGLKNDVANSSVDRVLGYSLQELRHHLERQFTKGMTWQTMSVRGWHIDHILPRRCFDLTTTDGVRAYWALPNLRPLMARDNLRKGSKVVSLL